MSIAVAITNHNQDKQVKKTIDMLMSAEYKPETIFVMSDDTKFKPIKKYPEVEVINNKFYQPNRCDNRNSVIKKFLDSGIDQLVFIDGDCYPDTKEFLKNYELLLNNHDLVFGTRRHTDVSKLKLPPSDLLTANMDNLFKQKKLDYSDLRIVSGAISAWRGAKQFGEKIDLMLTGMIGWSCNFGITRIGLKKLMSFQKDTFGMETGIFDNSAFNNDWSYEDIAMGMDALYAGLDIDITDGVRVVHVSHNRSDGLFDHNTGKISGLF